MAEYIPPELKRWLKRPGNRWRRRYWRLEKGLPLTWVYMDYILSLSD